MSGTKQFALRRLPSRKSSFRGWLPLGVALSLALAAPLHAQRVPLPPAEQGAVNEAITRGVGYLRRTQQQSGTWAKVGVGHRIGYAVLPGLTLLECGVPASDPMIQKAADYLRTRAAGLDTTYELSLGILFLDRLGDPKDKKIIQTFALRLVAGQSATGGWGYKCPLLPPQNQRELLIALRHLDPRPIGMPGIAGKPGGMPGIAGKPGGMPGIAGNPGGMPGIAGGPGKAPADLAPIAKTPGGPPLEGAAQEPGTPSLSGSISRGGDGESPSLSGGLLGSGLSDSLSPRELIPTSPSRWRDCLGLDMLDRREPEPLATDAKARTGQEDVPARPDENDKPRPPRPDKPYVIPSRLRLLTVVQDPALHILEDPRGQRKDLIFTTTDNSNTQFAILALWTAQRYEVPMHRTLNLIVRRYLTSQNINGTWNYHYCFGGALKHEGFSSPGAMTCVGLIGLAVGHGLAQPVAGQPVQDPRILRGLIALYMMVGRPTERLTRVPLQNLYYLWSLERVAVLYRMPLIGDKDWYRWGAQMLVTNQNAQGSWAGGGYPGSSSTLNSCLALLFLKRANLAKDLTSKLPFKAADLNQGILEKLTPSLSPPADAPPKPSEPSKDLKESISATQPVKQGAADKPVAKPSPSLNGTASPGAAHAEEAGPDTSGGNTKWIVLSLLVFILFAGGSVLVLFVARPRDVEEDEEKNDKPAKRKAKHKLQSTQ
ncbi:MAG TPA: hypothetical protein VMG10_22970 [Gemmataceae bacterium]|nr:hypothetical protein [Gemmataceae bacterium]